MPIVLEVKFNHIGDITDEMQAKAEQAVKIATLEAETLAKGYAPVDIGNLKASITNEIEGMNGAIWTGVEYAAHQEYGTVNHPAHPYFTPAIEGVRDEFVSDMKDIFGG